MRAAPSRSTLATSWISDMPIKEDKYYKSLTLQDCAAKIRRNEVRGRQEVFTEMLAALVFRCSTEKFRREDILAGLGEPDSREVKGDIEILVYKWWGRHGPTKYRSETRLVLKRGILIGTPRSYKL